MLDRTITIGNDTGSVMTLTLTVPDYTTPVEVNALQAAAREHEGELRGILLRIESAAMIRRSDVSDEPWR